MILLAYIGPGAGFAVAISFFTILVAIFLGIAALLFWPFRMLWAFSTGRWKTGKRGRFGRVIIVGLDGLDYERTTKLLASNRLPNLKQLQETGHYAPLQSTSPPISPVAWASFLTGVNPGKHNIFDFISRDPKTYRIQLSSSRVTNAGNVRGLRKSVPFWKYLGESGIPSSTIRIPITFPAEAYPLNVTLSGMCVPDLRGTQGQFTFFTTDLTRTEIAAGSVETFQFERGQADVILHGPIDKDGKTRSIPMRIKFRDGKVTLRVGGAKVRLELGKYSPWVPLSFGITRFRKAHGICRFLITELEPEFGLYVTPIHIDPIKPSLPISYPPYFATYLAKLLGRFATLGIAEDTHSRTESLVDDAAFLDQVWQIHQEREDQFFALLNRFRSGCHVCVFDAPDRIQHLFTRQNPEADVPGEANGNAAGSTENSETVIDDMYARLDHLVGRLLGVLKKDDLLLVISDHGFTTFNRAVHINAWLREQGYLHLLPEHEDTDYLRAVDWERTRAYAFGLSGIYINRKGREGKGIVPSIECDALALELQEQLSKLKDPVTGEKPIHRIVHSKNVYAGPYKTNGPDVIVGYAKGYRVSWECAVGRCSGPVFSDNTKVWSGDHCVDVDLVPGVLFANRRVKSDRPLELIDLAPSVLRCFGLVPPKHMDGRPLELADDPPNEIYPKD